MCDRTTLEDQRAIEDWLKTHEPNRGTPLWARGSKPDLGDGIEHLMFDPAYMPDGTDYHETRQIRANFIFGKGPKNFVARPRKRRLGGFRPRRGGIRPMLAPGE